MVHCNFDNFASPAATTTTATAPETRCLNPASALNPRTVFAPELIREVESRMNRDYLPPTLKSLSQSPPNGTYPVGMGPMGMGKGVSPPHSLPLVAAAGGGSSVPLVAANNRRFNRGVHSKLPTVQEGGKSQVFNWNGSLECPIGCY